MFQYVVGPGQRTARLDYADEWALRTNGAAVVEADGESEGTGNYQGQPDYRPAGTGAGDGRSW